MVLTEIIGIVIIALSILYIYYKCVIFQFWHKRGVFYIEPVVPTGNITALIAKKKQLGVFFHDIYVKYKNHRVIGIYTLHKPSLVIADLDLIRTVLTKEFGSFHDRGLYYNEKVDPLSGNLFLMSGQRWQNLHSKLTPTFTLKKIKQMFPILKECSEELVKYLDNKAQMKDVIELKDIFARYTTDVIMSAVFGIKSNCVKEPNNEYHMNGKKVFKLNSFWIALSTILPQVMDFFSIPLMDRQITSFYMNMFRENVKYRQTHNIVRHDFMNLLIQLMEKGYVEPDDNKKTTNELPTIHKLTMVEAAAQSFAFFTGGFDTSSTTATFALYELAQHHNMQDKVRQEIDEILAKHGDMTYNALNEMTYLHKVIKETLRKYPTLPVLSRTCTKDIVLPTTNIYVPKGTLINIPVLGLHRDPSIYPDPDKFDPERFNVDMVAERHPYAYLPFGEGPRICIGARFGYMQVKFGLACLLSKYKFNLHPRTQVPIIFNKDCPGLIAKGGIHLIIKSR